MAYTKSDIWTDCGQQQLWVRLWHCGHGGGERLWRSWNWATLQGECACKQSYYTKNIPVQKWHTPSASEDKQGEPLDRQQATSNLVLDTALLPSKQCGTHIQRGLQKKGQSSPLLSLFLLYFVEIMTLLVKAYRGSSGVAPLILNFSIKWRRVHNVIPWPFYPQGRNPSTHWMGGWVGSGPGLDVFWEEEMSCPYWDSNRMPLGL